MVLLFYNTYISVDIVHHEIFRAKVGKGGIKRLDVFQSLTVIYALCEGTATNRHINRK